MTKKHLIKNILELGKELEKANGFDAVMIINDMEIEVDNYTKQLPIHNVSQQRELLIADFIEKYNKGLVGNERIYEDCLEDYLQGNL